MRNPLSVAGAIACALALGAGACDEPGLDDPSGRGGWDGNSGNYNGNLGSFGTVQGVGGVPPWALAATGAGTVTNSTMYGLQWAASQSTTPCAAPTAGVARVRFLSSSGDAVAQIGPDLEVERVGGARARLALGEEIVFPGRVFDGYLNAVEGMFRARAVDRLEYRNRPGYEWPVFSLELCQNGPLGEPAPALPGWKHLGFVSWAPFVQLPELDGQPFVFHDDIVQAITTIPRDEYRDNPNVPVVVANQSGALWFKFAFFSGTPIALGREAALDLRSSSGQRIGNAEFLFRGALALGNASWVTLPPDEDPVRHRFLSFFTRDGTEVALFGLTRGNGLAAGEIHQPSAWGGGVVEALQLTDDERTDEAALSLDSVQAVIDPSALAGQQLAAMPTHAGSGRSTYRVGLYFGSPNPRKFWFYQVYRSGIEATRLGAISGRIPTQTLLANELRLPTGAVTMLVAAQSPLPPGTQPFEQPRNVDPPPPGAPVIPPVMPIDAPMMIDAPVVDARVIDAPMVIDGGDAMVDAGVDAPMEAGMDSGFDGPVDAPMEGGMDGGFDGPVDAPMEGGMDGGFDGPVDAPMEGGMDGGFDAFVFPDASCIPCDATPG